MVCSIQIPELKSNAATHIGIMLYLQQSYLAQRKSMAGFGMA